MKFILILLILLTSCASHPILVSDPSNFIVCMDRCEASLVDSVKFRNLHLNSKNIYLESKCLNENSSDGCLSQESLNYDFSIASKIKNICSNHCVRETRLDPSVTLKF